MTSGDAVISNVFILGGTHSTLQDIKLPQRAGGYWYKDSKKANTRNRFIYWYVTKII